MDKKDVARGLEEIAGFLELKGENPFRIRAYRTAARTIATFPGELGTALASGALAEVKGVGPAILELVGELVTTGRSRVLEDLRDEVPPGLVEMLQISGLGVTKVRQIHETLHVETLAELEEAARDGRLAKLPRFGKKTTENILKGIDFLRQSTGFRLFHHARTEATALAEVLRTMPGVRRVAVAGSVRRRAEIIRDLDFVVELEGSAGPLVERLGAAPGVREVVSKTERAITLRFGSGTVADIYLAPRERFGFELIRATGGAEHLEQLAERARPRGLAWDAGLAGCEEAEVYQELGLDLIPAELREGQGEIAAAAAGRLPALVERSDLAGFLHCHTNYSDGASTVAEWADACRAAGYRYVGLTDHSKSAAYAGGLREDDIPRQHAEVDDANRRFTDFRILKGVEADILQDGTLDYTPEIRAGFDFIIASVHSRYGMDEARMTQRVLKAMDDPHTAILGHPTGRLLLSRDPYPLDLDAIFARAAERGVAIEINADPQRLDLDWRAVRRAVAAGVTISLGADAHGVSAIGVMELGVGIARKAWLTKAEVLNVEPVEAFLAFVARRRGHS
ncbi:MAG: DNA polymerase/3'-5' exonuclease PolX [Gemmatimonadetes bacterium]|nr:DNA polymerase/3'-5' exonuclease PolX [Gemmatimonadota bacterium]